MKNKYYTGPALCLILVASFSIPFMPASAAPVPVSVIPDMQGSTDIGWQDVFFEDFEGDFLGQWTVSVAPGSADAYWGKEDFNIYKSQNPYDGNFAAYCAKNGSQAVVLPGYYPPNMDTTMTCGPFDLSLAIDATFSFVAKAAIGDGQDRFEYSVSVDGINFYGSGFGSEENCESLYTLDLKNVPQLGNICGQPQVWVSFRFVSDNVSENERGITIDDVLLSKWVPEGTLPQIISISPPTASAGTDTPVTITGTDFGSQQSTSRVEFWQKHIDPASSQYQPADIISWTDTEIVCTVPIRASGSDNEYGILRGVRVFGPAGWSDDFPFNVTFGYEGSKWPGDSPIGHRFFVNPNTDDCEGELEALIRAAQTWNSVSDADFYFEYGGLTESTKHTFGTFEIFWQDAGPDAGWAAITHLSLYKGEITDCCMIFNDYYQWTTHGSGGCDVQIIATHEFGHCLGLSDLWGEVQHSGKMMGAEAPKTLTLAPEDIEGIRWIYPGTGTRGQFHLSVTNTTANPQEVYFKSDIDAEFTRSFTVAAGETRNSWWEVVPAGSRQVSIQWTDPGDNTLQTLVSEYQEVAVEGDTEFSFVIETSQPVNQPPVLDPIGNKTGTVGQLMQFTVSATDPDDDALTYSATGLPAGAEFDPASRTFSWTPDTAGTYPGITFSVTDGKTPPASETITITVEQAPPDLYTLTVNTVGQGSVSINPDQASYTAGTTVELTAIPAGDWSFSGWSGAVAEADNPVSVMIDEDKVITATFTRNSPPSGGGGGGGGMPVSSGGSGSGGTDTKRFTAVSGSVTAEGVLWEDIVALSVDIQFELLIPKGTKLLNANGYPPFAITIAMVTGPDDPEDGVCIGAAYEATPDGITMSQVSTLSMKYEENDLPAGIDEACLSIAAWNEERQDWDMLPSVVDTGNNLLTTGIEHFSRYVIIAGTRPAVFSISDIAVNPGTAEHGGMVTVSATVANTGDLTGDCNLVCSLDGTMIEAKQLTLKGGESKDITFTFMSGSTGGHVIEINGTSASFEVLPSPAVFVIEDVLLDTGMAVPGDTIIVTAIVMNTGETGGSFTLECSVDGSIAAEQEIYVDGQTSEEVIVSFPVPEIGLHSVEINGTYAGSVSVAPVPEQEGTVAAESLGEPLTSPSGAAIDKDSFSGDQDGSSGTTTLLIVAGVVVAVSIGAAVIINRSRRIHEL